ncbi:hypothetical protein RB608_17250 [Nocardioides sp. LHD-245]|uniref:hypothetical protein n=1 Tax=Nocardioides sp. LHD-245 TaxID=3051387 RepID=UPI0027E0B658|nr:hypothetical protein [Nocardioides sp. LHD-245]
MTDTTPAQRRPRDGRATPRRSPLSRALLALTTAAVLSAGLTACDSSDDEPAAEDRSTATAEPTLTAAQQAACDGLLDAATALLDLGGSGDDGPSDEQLTQVGDVYEGLASGLSGDEQAAATKVAATIDEVVQTGNKKLLEDESLLGAMLAPAAAGRALCAYAPVDFMAHETPAAGADGTPEMAYMGLPVALPAGRTSFQLTNEGQDFHEALVMKVKDSYTGTMDDLLQLDDEAMMQAADIVAATMTAPGETAFTNVDLATGRYIVLCHIPVMDGAGPDAQPKMGATGPIWHYTVGMAHEVTVS